MPLLQAASTMVSLLARKISLVNWAAIRRGSSPSPTERLSLPAAERAPCAGNLTYQLEVSGGDIKAVQGNTGHAQAGILVNTYAHIQNQARIELAARIERDFYPAEEKETPVHNPTIRTEKMSFSDILELIQQADPAQKKQLTLALLA